MLFPVSKKSLPYSTIWEGCSFYTLSVSDFFFTGFLTGNTEYCKRCCRKSCIPGCLLHIACFRIYSSQCCAGRLLTGLGLCGLALLRIFLCHTSGCTSCGHIRCQFCRRAGGRSGIFISIRFIRISYQRLTSCQLQTCYIVRAERSCHKNSVFRPHYKSE